MGTKTIAEHAAEHLRENDEDGLMWGDVTLAHEVADRAGVPQRGMRTSGLILLNALEGSPLFRKELIPVHIPGAGERLVRSFKLVGINAASHNLASSNAAQASFHKQRDIPCDLPGAFLAIDSPLVRRILGLLDASSRI